MKRNIAKFVKNAILSVITILFLLGIQHVSAQCNPTNTLTISGASSVTNCTSTATYNVASPDPGACYIWATALGTITSGQTTSSITINIGCLNPCLPQYEQYFSINVTEFYNCDYNSCADEVGQKQVHFVCN